MQSRFFGGLVDAEVVIPEGNVVDVHEAYLQIARTGVADAASRDLLISAGRSLVESRGAEAVLLGGTDLVLVMGAGLDFPVVDCAGVHVDALAELAARPPR